MSRELMQHIESACNTAGITRVLVNVLKHGQRAQVLPMAQQIWPAALQLQSSMAAASSALSRCAVPGTVLQVTHCKHHCVLYSDYAKLVRDAHCR